MIHDATAPSSARPMTRRGFVRATSVGAIGLTAATVLTACGADGTARNDHAEIIIEMTDAMRFAPETVAVAPGTTIRFENTSTGFVHTATCDPALARGPAAVARPEGAAPWDSGNVAPGASWSVVLDVPGEYRYVCLPHELAGMVGTIVVEAAASG